MTLIKKKKAAQHRVSNDPINYAENFYKIADCCMTVFCLMMIV